MDDDHRVWVLTIILSFIILLSLILWQWHASSMHTGNLEQHRQAVEVCIQGVTSDLAKVDCLRSSLAISHSVGATQ